MAVAEVTGSESRTSMVCLNRLPSEATAGLVESVVTVKVATALVTLLKLFSITNNFSSVTSAVATLTVTTDSTKPAVASLGSLFKQTIEVRLSEPVTSATAINTANYLLFSSAGTPVAVSSAVQDVNDGAHITL